MSAFDRIVKELESRTGGDREAELNEFRAQCVCPDCPTYTKCAGDAGELLYCFLGRSGECITEEMGCNCPDCPLAARAELVNIYYCINGSEVEMRKEQGEPDAQHR
ncbi:MAG: DUF2769 domain-containing protein [Methanomassiliicoccus sp.]|nr:DUF2769 domain-containing protein [Methanomassiliicoccus sp.]